MTHDTLIKIRCYACIATWIAKTIALALMAIVAVNFVMSFTATKCLDNPDWCSVIAQGKM